jgi:hypothetical protein
MADDGYEAGAVPATGVPPAPPQLTQRNGHAFGKRPRPPGRFNVALLSTGFGDQLYAWRSSLDGSLIQFVTVPDQPEPFWVNHLGGGQWNKISNQMVTARPGERFIRVGQALNS